MLQVDGAIFVLNLAGVLRGEVGTCSTSRPWRIARLKMGTGRLNEKVDEHSALAAWLPSQSVVCRCALEALVMLFCGVGTAVQ